MKCSSCGAEISSDSRFCRICGTPVNREDTNNESNNISENKVEENNEGNNKDIELTDNIDITKISLVKDEKNVSNNEDTQNNNKLIIDEKNEEKQTKEEVLNQVQSDKAILLENEQKDNLSGETVAFNPFDFSKIDTSISDSEAEETVAEEENEKSPTMEVTILPGSMDAIPLASDSSKQVENILKEMNEPKLDEKPIISSDNHMSVPNIFGLNGDADDLEESTDNSIELGSLSSVESKAALDSYINENNDTDNHNSPKLDLLAVDDSFGTTPSVEKMLGKSNNERTTDADNQVNKINLIENVNDMPSPIPYQNQPKKNNKCLIAGLIIALILLIGSLVGVALLYVSSNEKEEKINKLDDEINQLKDDNEMLNSKLEDAKKESPLSFNGYNFSLDNFKFDNNGIVTSISGYDANIFIGLGSNYINLRTAKTRNTYRSYLIKKGFQVTEYGLKVDNNVEYVVYKAIDSNKRNYYIALSKLSDTDSIGFVLMSNDEISDEVLSALNDTIPKFSKDNEYQEVSLELFTDN